MAELTLEEVEAAIKKQGDAQGMWLLHGIALQLQGRDVTAANMAERMSVDEATARMRIRQLVEHGLIESMPDCDGSCIDREELARIISVPEITPDMLYHDLMEDCPIHEKAVRIRDDKIGATAQKVREIIEHWKGE